MITQKSKILNISGYQLVCLPKGFEFDGDEVLITKKGERLLLTPINSSWDCFFSQVSAFDENYMEERE